MTINRHDDMKTHEILTRIYERIVSPGGDLRDIIRPADGMYLDDLERRLMRFDVTLLNTGNFHIYTDVLGKFVLIKQMQDEIIQAMRAINEGRNNQ